MFRDLIENLFAQLSLRAARMDRDEDGATAIEYGLIAALIAVAIMATLALLGTNLEAVFSAIAEELGSVS